MSSDKGKELPRQIDEIKKYYNTLLQEVDKQNIEKTLLSQIAQWEKEAITKIESTAQRARADLNRLTKQSRGRLASLMETLSHDLHSKTNTNNYRESNIVKWKRLLEDCRNELKALSEIKMVNDGSSSINPIKIDKANVAEKESNVSLPPIVDRFAERPNKTVESTALTRRGHFTTGRADLSNHRAIASPIRPYAYQSIIVSNSQSTDPDILRLFQHLKSLPPMDKNGPMSGNCDIETRQMEKFLSRTFDFKNVPEEYIVSGVRSFRLGRHPLSMRKDEAIHFPDRTTNSFAMTVQEIIDWQQSYAVYADRNEKDMTKEFLQRALRGLSKDGEEAFRMKFVVRISTCPILMEFDARIIPRIAEEVWSHRIKLVSVTGVDFAGRKHDVNDIVTYVPNWQDVYEIDPRSRSLLVYNGRDFQPKVNGSRGMLDQQRLLNDLIRMARLRMRACDEEGVQIVVETGIGLGVFAGKHIGIDEQVRALSARAIRVVMEQDGPSYKTIRGVVFALPIFDDGQSNGRVRDAYQAFASEFETKKYNGPIPVLIADQDMHRLTVAIARQGFTVSELNPADSHGVFGEYWQNRGPAVEEKLALTTVGLLVQHHLINPHVLDPKNYYLI